jgi:hypothetical protein
VGCGTGGPSTQGTVALPPIRGPKPPKGASPLLRQAYRNFQPPLADPEVKGSAKAIKAGEAACKGKTPLEAKEEFISRSDLSAAQRESLQAIEAAEAHPSADFVAGQLAALAYEGTLEGALAQYGYRGCVYALAEGLKGELAKNSRSDP